jgi:hypothetical protein
MKRESFITLALKVTMLENIFSLSLKKRPNKLERLSLYGQIFARMAGAYLGVIGWRGSPWTNAIAYLVSSSVMKRESFIILTLKVSILEKVFSSSLKKMPNKLERLSLYGQIFARKAGAYLGVIGWKAHPGLTL